MSHSESGSPPRIDAIAAFLVDIDELPSPPALVLQIVDYTASTNLSISVLAELVGRDGALTAKLLRMANSSIYSFPSEITSVERAIMVLGVKAVRLLTLSLSLSALFPTRTEHPDLLLEVRRRSVVSALANRGFLNEIDPSLREEGFLVGLLHSVGALVVAQSDPASFGRLFADGWPGIDDQRAVLGFTLDELAIALFDGWRLPGFLADVVRARNDGPDRSSDHDPVIETLVLALELATLAERVLCDVPDGRALLELSELAAQTLELGADRVEAILIGMGPQIRETAELLSLPLPAGLDHEHMVRSAAEAMQRLSLEAMTLMAEQSGHLAELGFRNDELERDALVDPLTGMGNLRAFEERIEACVAMRRRRSFSDWLGLMVISIDGRADLGHRGGSGLAEMTVAHVAGLLQRHCRADEDFFRIGPAEFALVMPHALADDLGGAAARFRELVERSTPLSDTVDVAVTACIGGELAHDVGAPDAGGTLRRHVAENLRCAQQAGRNRICVDPHLAPPTPPGP